MYVKELNPLTTQCPAADNIKTSTFTNISMKSFVNRRGIAISYSRPGQHGQIITKTIIKMVQTAALLSMQTLEYEFDSAARMSNKRLGSVRNCPWGYAL